jgi:hypothetical protein
MEIFQLGARNSRQLLAVKEPTRRLMGGNGCVKQYFNPLSVSYRGEEPIFG